MCRTLKSFANAKNKKTIVALVCLISFIVFFLLSEAFIIVNANHEHDTNGVNGRCSICDQMKNFENLLNQFRVAIKFALFVFSISLLIIPALYDVLSLCENKTLVELRIRINN